MVVCLGNELWAFMGCNASDEHKSLSTNMFFVHINAMWNDFDGATAMLFGSSCEISGGRDADIEALRTSSHCFVSLLSCL